MRIVFAQQSKGNKRRVVGEKINLKAQNKGMKDGFLQPEIKKLGK